MPAICESSSGEDVEYDTDGVRPSADAGWADCVPEEVAAEVTPGVRPGERGASHMVRDKEEEKDRDADVGADRMCWG